MIILINLKQLIMNFWIINCWIKFRILFLESSLSQRCFLTWHVDNTSVSIIIYFIKFTTIIESGTDIGWCWNCNWYLEVIWITSNLYWTFLNIFLTSVLIGKETPWCTIASTCWVKPSNNVLNFIFHATLIKYL